jgi:hypothetical protein
MIIWGGSVGGSNQGWKYNPETDSWTAISTTNVPSGRYYHTATWTGSEMIVWGGVSGTSPLDTGGKYNPLADSWTSTSLTNQPSARYDHTAIFTGNQLVVWGGFDNNSRLNTGGEYCAPMPIYISGTVVYCPNPTVPSLSGVTLTLTGDATGAKVSDGFGNYIFAIPPGGNYTVTPGKTALAPGSGGINTVDVIAIQRHFLNLTLLTGCRLTAADVNGVNGVDTVDVVATQRFFLNYSTGIANVGKYKFTPVSRSYSAVVTTQAGQNYDTLIFGDVAPGFVH